MVKRQQQYPPLHILLLMYNEPVSFIQKAHQDGGAWTDCPEIACVGMMQSHIYIAVDMHDSKSLGTALGGEAMEI